METVKISSIKSRAKRLRQPEMVDRYKEMAITWDEGGGICELVEDDWEYLNTLWDETRRGHNNNHSAPCGNCRGL